MDEQRFNAIEESVRQLLVLALDARERTIRNEERHSQNTADLKNHMRRSEANEARLEHLESILDWFKTTFKVIGGVGIAAGAAIAVYNLWHLF